MVGEKINKAKKICFVHYGIGWRDGINIVLKNLTGALKRKCPWLDIFLLGGEIKEEILPQATYKTLPELLPATKKITRSYLKKQSALIAKKLAVLTRGIDTIIIENPFLGDYHLAAMLGYLLYAKKYKPKGTKLFFRIHDYFRDSKRYSRNIKKFFSAREIKSMLNNEKVDGFFVINRSLKEKLIKEGIPSRKIFYLPNGINEILFTRTLTKKEKKMLKKTLNTPEKANILLYPVRVVPRKNIEEAILLTYFLRKASSRNYILVISGLIDTNDPQGRRYYQGLKEIKEKLDFPVIFAKGILPTEREYDWAGRIKKFGIGDLYKISEAILSTSFREGFGYFFLECWLAGKIIIGRRIEEVTSDFERSGLDFSWLYRNFFVDKNRDLIDIKNEKKFSGVAKVKKIFNNKETLEKVFKLNKINLTSTIKILQNKDLQSKTIKHNLEKTRKVYEISKITERFLQFTGLK